MFALREIAVSLTFVVLTYCLVSALVVVAWRWLKLLRVGESALANLLFALRVLPLVSSAAIVILFVVPSFQLLEPRASNEGLGTMPLALGVCAVLLIACGCLRVFNALTKTSRIVAQWQEGARPLNIEGGAPTIAYCSRADAPPLTLVGVRKPRVLVSEATVALLTVDELFVALKHEFVHVRSRDNLKKLIFCFCPFPGMANLESAWSQATELAADHSAVSSLNDAVDLAATLVKLSRLVPVEPAPVCTVGFVSGCISSRVARLLAWEQRSQSRNQIQPWHLFPAALTVMLCVIVTYRPLLVLTHEVTEWLVR
jgi:Zn-dependent protease with chaperone function